MLVFDIETSPALGWIWQLHQTDVIEVEQQWFILSFAYRWLGEKTVHSVALPDFPKRYKRDPEDDYEVVSALWHLFNEADIVVSHNGLRFDQPRARARFLVHNFDPPTPFREIDTLQVARKKFNFLSNRLDALCRQLGIGGKAGHAGFATWRGCMKGDPKAWATMVRYNKRDVEMLEELYLRLRPWIDNHPNLAVIENRPEACPKCGAEGQMQARGSYKVNAVTRNKRWQCQSCGGFSHTRLAEKVERPRFAN